jgi:hypothetical protein
MQALSKIACPHCGAVLRSEQALCVGKSVECVRCHAPFTISAADALAGDIQSEPISVAAVPVPEAAHFLQAVGEPPAEALETSTPLPGRLQRVSGPITGAETPRLGILERAAKRQAPVVVRPMPRASDASVLTGAIAPPPQPRSPVAFIALGALLLFLAGGAVLAYFCFVNDTPDSTGVAAPGEQDRLSDKEDDDGTASVASAIDDKASGGPSDAVRPRPPKRTTPKEKSGRTGSSKDALPASSLFTSTKTAAPSHPEQKRINAAIEKGVAFVRGQQASSGSWIGGNRGHSVGYAALPGLTLLECGAKADDPVVQKAAKFVRTNTASLENTYDLALAILFLDKLGDSQDRLLIQRLALRLVAGQNAAGGWDYTCRVLTPQESSQLLNYLHTTRPQPALPNPINNPAAGTNANPLPPAGSAAQKNPTSPKSDDPKIKPKSAGGLTVRPEFLPEVIRNLPIAQKGKGKGKNIKAAGRDDNSNSQFALLALWAARRHDVPTERTLALAEERYHVYQKADGGWGYMIGQDSTPSMTCVGLLGLAMGHGASEDAMLAAAKKNNRDAAVISKEDPAIQRGLRALGARIGNPYSTGATPPMANLYFLWSLERVAMLYNLPTIGNKDWYGWGVSILLPNQKPNGSWHSVPYPGYQQANHTIDTCFALLFLKRSNLVQDLTENLMLYMAISDPDARK